MLKGIYNLFTNAYFAQFFLYGKPDAESESDIQEPVCIGWGTAQYRALNDKKATKRIESLSEDPTPIEIMLKRLPEELDYDAIEVSGELYISLEQMEPCSYRLIGRFSLDD